MRQRRAPKTHSRISIQLEPGELHVASATRRLAGLELEETRVDSASIHLIRAAPRCVLVIVGSMRRGTLFVNGYELASDSCIIVDGDAEAELVAHAGSSWVSHSLSRGDAGELSLVSTRRALGLSAGVRLVRSWRPPARKGEKHALACAIQDRRLRRRLAVERARTYISSHLADRIRLADLCAHAQVRARSLEYGFRELVGIPPMAYVRMLRLGAVRTLLLDGAAPARDISAIALDSGFSHVSQFFVDYKRVFGETPSTTRRNARRNIVSRHWSPRRGGTAGLPQPARFADSLPAFATG
jgi:AraC-like DNA-binding protein